MIDVERMLNKPSVTSVAAEGTQAAQKMASGKPFAQYDNVVMKWL